MAEDGDTRHTMYEAGVSANMLLTRGRRLNHPEAQLHQPNQSAPSVFDPSSVIDLTEEPDDYLRRDAAATQPPQQPRQPAPVIDLTGLPDSPNQTQYREVASSGRSMSHFMDLVTHSSDSRSAHENPATSRIESQPSGTRSASGHNFHDLFRLNTARFLAQQPGPKPRTPSPPPPRAGFTRNTCADPEKDYESVAICPACCNELAYDPADTVLHSPVNASKGKRKRAPEERHFWALKNCGHVYCADCYNTKKPATTKRNGVDLRAPDERSPYLAAADFGCAVEDCKTRVSTEDGWVGIYL